MKTFLRVNLALMPLPLFLLGNWLGHGLTGAALGLLWNLAWLAQERQLRRPPALLAAQALALAVIILVHALPVSALLPFGHALLMAGLAGGAALSLAQGRPWTGAFSAADYDGMADTPLFHRVNVAMSALWGALFLWLAVAGALGWPAMAHWLPLVAGGIASVVLPGLLVARGLARIAAGDRRNTWQPPHFGIPASAPPGGEARCDVAVIGAGIGGLTAAALLADAGLKVEVFEQHVVPGGFAHTWLRRARTRDPATGEPLVFRFDSGVHDISGWYPGGTVRNLFERLGIADDTEWRRLDHRYVMGGRSIDVPRDWRAYVERLAGEHPHEAAGLRALFADIHAVHAGMYATAAARGGFPGAPATPRDVMAFARNHPLAVTWMDRPWRHFVARHVRDPAVAEWINALSGYITDDPERLSVADMVPLFGYYFHGGHYPVGGSGRMADSLVDAIARRGGRVHLRTPVNAILHAQGAATGLLVGPAGRERRIDARAVVCNADPGVMLASLLRDCPLAGEMAAQLGALQPTCSAVGVALGLRGALDLPPVIHVAAPDGWAGLVIPSAVDPACAPPGHAVVEILDLVGASEAASWLPQGAATDAARLEAWRDSGTYRARKREMGDRLIARAALAIPDLAERIVYRAESTPVTFRRYAWTSSGAIYGTRSAHGRLPTRMRLRNLVLAGAATHGPGVEAVVISGAEAARALLPGVLQSKPSRVAA